MHGLFCCLPEGRRGRGRLGRVHQRHVSVVGGVEEVTGHAGKTLYLHEFLLLLELLLLDLLHVTEVV